MVKKQKTHLCKNCFTEWVTQENNCKTCKEFNKDKMAYLKKQLNFCINILNG